MLTLLQLSEKEETLRSALELHESHERQVKDVNVKLETCVKALTKISPKSGQTDAQLEQLQVSGARLDRISCRSVEQDSTEAATGAERHNFIVAVCCRVS